MREIKFRYVWKRKLDNHIWIEIVPIECIEGKGDKPFILQDNSLWDLISRDLYTNLPDKNGKEIYEGDIVRVKDWTSADDWKYVNAVVEYIPHSGMYLATNEKEEASYMADMIKCSEIIGNIYENPELLKEVKNVK